MLCVTPCAVAGCATSNQIMKFLLCALPVALLILGGCSGGSGLSGPNSNTQKGLGTLIVRVKGSGVNSGAAIVTLDSKAVQVVRDNKVTFLDVTPGRHFVEARYQSTGFSSDGSNVDIEANKTRTITLELSPEFAPTPTRSPFGD